MNKNYLTLSFFLLLFSCSSKTELERNNEIGIHFTSIKPVHSVNKNLYCGKITGRHEKNVYYSFPIGTEFELNELELIKSWTWNNGFYSHHSGKLKVITGEKKGELYQIGYMISGSHIGAKNGTQYLKKKP